MVDHKTLKVSAVIIAAGFSSRMHGFKPLLTLGNQTVLEKSVSIFTQAGITEIVVVIGHKSHTLMPLIEALGVKWVINPNYELGMFSSIQAGVKSIESECDCFFMLPVDVPLVKSNTIEEMRAAFDNQNMNVLYPSFNGRRGHPPLMTSRLIPDLLLSPDSGGLKTFLERQGKASYLVVQDPGILLDMDTEADYEKIKIAMKGL